MSVRGSCETATPCSPSSIRRSLEMKCLCALPSSPQWSPDGVASPRSPPTSRRASTWPIPRSASSSPRSTSPSPHAPTRRTSTGGSRRRIPPPTPPRPEPWMLEAIRGAADRSAAIVVMSATGARLLRETYGISKVPIVIEHGMPVIQPHGRRRLKRALAMEDRSVISTFGLVDPRKGLEYVVEALPAIVARHPRALYLVIGQTHPELLKRQGEAYRNSLIETARRVGVTDQLRFVNEYLTQGEIVEYLLASDVYVTPYLDPGQITSGTLAYALGAGKAIVSTPYLHASEVLADDRGTLVPFRDAGAIADAVSGILGDPLRKRALEERAYAYGRATTWPAIGAQVLTLMRHVAASREE